MILGVNGLFLVGTPVFSDSQEVMEPGRLQVMPVNYDQNWPCEA